MTKEEKSELLKKHSVYMCDNSGVHAAMDEYAEQTSIEFFKWYVWKMTGFLEYLKNVKPIVTSNEIEENLIKFEGKSFNELYSLFKQSQQS